ncbi:MAG: hypothetical protein L0332_00100 [Chloroflexi bacterium]|nr:hypothetical protein [Chloroflexota bacterium]MCI0576522.1 hypothetical protein [Chloroflexota bacterium]MCI0649837.1 hypothetical protein [Chloroflexota bacterium]MCI0725124.1 hypothetical protein [Chloroflexota bacterium]
MANHIKDEHLIGYVLQTLTDAEREHIDQHLVSCPVCRAALQEYEAQHRRIQYSLQAELQRARPSKQMHFAALAPHLLRARRLAALRQTSGWLLSRAAALAVLVLVLWLFSNSARQQVAVATPTATRPVEIPTIQPVPIPATRLSLGDGRIILGWQAPQTVYLTSLAGAVFPGVADSQYRMGLDREVSYEGRQSATIKGMAAEPTYPGYLLQTIPAGPYRGQRVRLSAYLQTAEVSGQWGIAALAADATGRVINEGMESSAVASGSQAWTRYEIVLDVPAESATLTLGAWLFGAGLLWVDGWQVEVVDASVPVTHALATEPTNLEFEQPLGQEWSLSSSRVDAYQAESDGSAFTTGQVSGVVWSETARNSDYGQLGQFFVPQTYLGRRLRFSADVKTEDARGAYLWLRISGPRGQVLQLDNMEERMIQGTTGWNRYEIVLDIPAESVGANFGLGLQGQGRAWIDNIRLEVVGEETPATGLPYPERFSLQEAALRARLQPDGLANHWVSTPLTGWFVSGDTKQYEADTDESSGYGDSLSAFLRSREPAAGAATLVQMLSAARYRGQRVSLTLVLRTAGVTGQAAPWLRIDGIKPYYILGLASPAGLSGDADWTMIELILDVPEEAYVITFGVYLEGSGQVWVDEVHLGAVGDEAPTANLLDSPGPVNLGFEE